MNATVIKFPLPDKEKPRKRYLLGKPTASITDLAAYRKAAVDMCRPEHPAMTLAQIVQLQAMLNAGRFRYQPQP